MEETVSFGFMIHKHPVLTKKPNYLTKTVKSVEQMDVIEDKTAVEWREENASAIKEGVKLPVPFFFIKMSPRKFGNG
eukprot:13397258-Ditylum_brightwellii.AAC.1